MTPRYDIPLGARVIFVGRPCPRTEAAGLVQGATLTVNRIDGWRLRPDLRRYGFAENELLLMPEDVEVIDDENIPE